MLLEALMLGKVRGSGELLGEMGSGLQAGSQALEEGESGDGA